MNLSEAILWIFLIIIYIGLPVHVGYFIWQEDRSRKQWRQQKKAEVNHLLDLHNEIKNEPL